MYDKELLKKAKEKINLLEYIENYTNTKAKKVGKSYILTTCPKCGHKDHFSINVDENYYKSFSNCCKGGTIVDFIEEFEKLSTDEAIEKTLSLAHIDNLKSRGDLNKYKKGGLNKMNANFNNVINEAHKNVGQTDYFHNRGLGDEIINKYKLGYSDAGFNFAINNDSDINETENDIFQYYKYYLPILDEKNDCSYFITRIDDGVVPSNLDIKKNHNLLGYSVQLFNQRYIEHSELFDNKYIFIVEGIFDALSIEDLGYKAIALNSSSNAKKFISIIERNKNKLNEINFILIPDNDKAGEEVQKLLENEFKRLKLNLQVCKLTNKVKDANELLQQDREKLKTFLEAEINKKKNEGFCISYINEFIKAIDSYRNEKIITTGINCIDKAIGGGLYPGLYTVGAVPSLGKTTLVHQIADYIAKNGEDVLYFSLEMGKFEMMKKSISREMFLIDRGKAATTREISQGKCDCEILNKAINNYRDNVAPNISIIEGNFNTNVFLIREMIKKNIEVRGKKPIIFVDYLQILKPYSDKLSDKQANDFNVTELKKISRDYNIPVVTISSLNRSNYSTMIGFESFKETGGIEYASDVVIGLQLKGIDMTAKNTTETEKRKLINDLKNKNPREIELVILKQREGVAYMSCNLKYNPQYNYFIE